MGPELHIKSVEIYKFSIKLSETFRISLMEYDQARGVFVKINASDGSCGFGEANPTAGIAGETQGTEAAGAKEVAGLLLGRNPLDVETRMAEIDRFLVHNATLRSAFDMALYDLLGQAAGLPLYALLGGGRRPFYTDNTIGISTPQAMAQKALAYQEAGFKAVKVKLGTTKDEDVARIKAIREAVGPDLPLRIDANQGWDFVTAVAVLRALEPLGVDYCEQPVAHWDHHNLRRVRQNTRIPIMADESLFDHHDAFKLAALGACDYFNIKLAKSGGLHGALKINAVAEAAGIPCMVGCMSGTRLMLTASAHLVSARPNVRFADLDGHFKLTEDPILGGVTYRAGDITLPEAPGLGAAVDPVFLEKCESVKVE
ncbi:MAG: dipeptide epimerase [Thermodesulfobacteriota bacterium]